MRNIVRRITLGDLSRLDDAGIPIPVRLPAILAAYVGEYTTCDRDGRPSVVLDHIPPGYVALVVMDEGGAPGAHRATFWEVEVQQA